MAELPDGAIDTVRKQLGRDEMAETILKRVAAQEKRYRDNAALVAVKVLAEAGQLVGLEESDGSSSTRKAR